MSRFQVAIVNMKDGNKLYCRDYSTLQRALNRIGENRSEEINFEWMTEDEYQAVPATVWSAELTAPDHESPHVG